MELTDIILNFCISGSANAASKLLEWIHKDKTLESRLESCYQRALKSWTVNKQIIDSVPFSYSSVSQLLAYLSGEPDIASNGVSKLMELWANEIRNDGFCYEFILETKIDSANEKIDKLCNPETGNEQRAYNFIASQKALFNGICSEIHGIADSYIEREEVSKLLDCINSFNSENKQRHCLLVGNAGVGKSAVLKKFVSLIESEGIKHIALKADAIGSNGTPTTIEDMSNAIASVAPAAEKTVLIIDQIDALSQTLSNDRNRLNEIIGLLSNLRMRSNIVPVISCRKYDLEYDSELNRLKDNSIIVELGNLTDENVSSILDLLEPGLKDKLDTTTRELLKTVQYLDTFCFLYHHNNKILNFGNPTELYDALWDTYVCEAPTPQSPALLEKSLFLIADTIRKLGTLKPVLKPTTEQKNSFRYLASAGLINRESHTVSFFHQTFYEYTLARQYASGGKSLVKDISESFQGLEIRTLIKAVLEYERGHNIMQFIDDSRSLIESGDIRFHIKLLAISILAFATNPEASEKKLIKDACKKDERIKLYFLRGVQDNGWFSTVKFLIKDILPGQKRDNFILFPIIGCLSKFAFNHSEDVYDLVNSIKDEDARLFSTAYVLRSHNDYSQSCVLKAYSEVRPQNTHFAVDLIRDAFQTNEKFAFEETEKLLIDYLHSDEKSNRHDGYELADVLFPELLNSRPQKLLQVLDNSIVHTIENSSFDGYYGFSITKVFNGLSMENYIDKLLKIYEDLLVRFSSDVGFLRPMLEKQIALNNETSVSMAFTAISANPSAYDDIIRPLLGKDATIEKYLSGDVRYFFLKMLRAWYDTLSPDDMAWFQKRLLSFKSSDEINAFKDKKVHRPIYLHPWNDKWDLICNALPETGLIPEMKKCSQEMFRRLGKRSIVERSNHSVSMAVYCGGVTSSEIYAKWPIDNWLNSFLKLKEDGRWLDGRTPIDLRVHADEFQKCVAFNPVKFKDFVFEISGRNDVQDMYKVAGVEGLLSGGIDPYSLWPLTKALITEEFSKKNSYSFQKTAEYYIREENPYFDEVIRVAESIAKAPYDDKRFASSGEDAERDLGRRATNLLERSINSPQGHAMEVLLKASQIPERRCQIFGILNKMLPTMPECIKALCLNYIHNNSSDDETLFYQFLKQLLSGLGCEALAIRGGAIQWCFYHKNDVVGNYIDRIEADDMSHEILSQIYFYGLSSEKNRSECEQRLENILKLNNENVVSKIVEVALKSFEQADIRKYSIRYLERFASDDRKAVANAYCWYCESLPVEAFKFYCNIAKTWAGKKHREIHSQLEYVKKCISRYPEECYDFIVVQKYSEIEEQWIADDDVVRVLLQIYGKLKEEENESCMNGIMDLFDEYIYRGNRMIMGAIDNIN